MKQSFLLMVVAVLAVATAEAGPFLDYNQGILSNDVRITGWATGWLNYVQPDPNSGGYCHDNSNQIATVDQGILGAPTDFTLSGTTKHTLALGHGASITVTFGRAIPNQPGWNFAIFNNAFLSTSVNLIGRGGGTNYVFFNSGTNLVGVARGDNFIWTKPAFVDVSSDALNWAHFPVTYLNTDVLFQASVPDSPAHWLSQDATMMDGLGGKMALQYGTPFSLRTLTNDPNVINGTVDLNNIQFVRVTDVIGDGSTFDQFGNPIYSPYYDGSQLPALIATPDSSTDGFCLRGAAILETPVPTILSAQLIPPSFVMNVSGLISGQTYVVQSTLNLLATWSNETSFVADQPAMTLTNASGAGPTKFFRIGAGP